MRIAHLKLGGVESYIIFDRHVFVRIDCDDGETTASVAGETPPQWFDDPGFWRELSWKIIHE